MPRAMLRRIRIERWITYALWAVMVAMLVWMAWTWAAYLELRAEQAERQTEHMTELLERSARRQEQMATLIREFRDSVEQEEASRREFEAKADAILKALDVQVERMSHKPVRWAPRVRRVVGQAGGAPRPREPPGADTPSDTFDTPGDTPTQPRQAHPHPHPEPKPKPRPKPRAQPQPPPRSQSPPQASNPPKAKREPSANSQQTAPQRPGKADPPGKAKGHSKQPPAKGRR